MILSSFLPHSRSTKEYICNLLLSLSLSSLYTKISRNKTKKKHKTNFALGRIDIFIKEKEKKREDFQEEIYPKF